MSHFRLRLCLLVGALLTLVGSANALAAGDVVISQVYGGGGNSGATYTNDFVELHNRTSSPVSITGWSVQYASSTGTTWQKTTLSGTIAPGGFYLVQQAAGAGGTTPLPTPDATGSIAMSGTAGKVALTTNDTLIAGGTGCPSVVQGAVDIVGYGSATNCSESAPTANLSNPTAALRNALGCTDTDNNASDFTIGAPAPRNSASPAALCGPPPATHLVVSEVYGGGGNSGATYTNDFIELHNPTASSVSVAGWSVQYASSAGTSWAVTPLTGSIPAGGRYLVQEAQGSGGTTPLPAPNVIGTIAMSSTSGKVALVSNSSALAGSCPTGGAIVDFVGYGSSASCFEGTGPTATLSNTTSASRNSVGTDTDDNAADFTVGAPDPRIPAEEAPRVTATTPLGGDTGVARAADIVVTFSEPVNVTGTWFTITCATSGAHTASYTGGPVTFTIDPGTDFAANESCTVTILAANVTDQDTSDPPDNMAANHIFSFTTIDAFICGDPATPIHAIQGSGLTAALTGTQTIEGVVVGDYQQTGGFNGYYLEEETSDQDADPATSEGIFVFAGSSGVDVDAGDVVRVRGTAGEFSGLTQLSSLSAVAVCSTGASVPATPVSLPVASITDHERYEGMLVRYDQTLTATEVFSLGRFGEVSLSGAGRLYNPTAVAAPGAPALAVMDQNNRSRIILDDGDNQQNIDPTRYPQGGLSATNTLRVGDTLPGLTGVMDFRFSNYRIQPVGLVEFTGTNLRTPAPGAVGGNLKIASFNVLNFFNGNGLGGGFPTARGANTQFELDRQKAKEVSALSAMNADIVGLMEIENDAGPNSALAELVAALNAAMGAGTYAYVDTGVIGTDEIKVALIYKPAAVTPVGAFALLTSAVDPRFVDTRNRPTLAQTFQHVSSGQKLTVAVNHLKSKGSACGAGDDATDGSGNCNGTRTEAAAALGDWLATDPTGSGDPDFLIIGDLNSYTFETPITTLEGAGYTNLVRAYGGLSAYSYVFSGESGYLDHALATSSLTSQVTGVTDWHINPDEPIVLDYNVEFKTANQVNTFYDPGPYRSSDHDPVVIGLQLNHAPAVSAGGPYTVPEGGSVGVTATGSDADGDTLTYAWDLDNDGTFETAGQTATFSAATIDGPATRTIRVRATDPGGLVAVSSATVTVTNVAPTATFVAPATALAGFPFTLALTGATDAAPADVAGLQYAFDCGSGYGAYSASSTASCTSVAVGALSVGGKVRDDDGGVTEYRATVQVQVTFASLCSLVRQYADKEGVANALCSKLDAAAAKSDRKGQEADLHAFVNQVEAQSGKSLTAEEAAVLVALAGAL